MTRGAGRTAPGRRLDLLLGLTALGVVARLWIMPLGSSLWLDEFGTVWVTGGSVREVLERARLFPQSLPYAALVKATRATFGSSEIALRLPSLFAMLAATYLLYRLGRDLFDRETGLCCAGIFLLFPAIEFAAADARSYAFAVLATIGALWMLVRWLDRGRPGDAAGYVLFAASAVYFQYLFASILVVHAVYALRRLRQGSRVSRGQALAAAACLALLLIPAAALVIEIGARRASHAFAPMPGLGSLLQSIVPFRVLGILVPCLLLCLAFRVARPGRALVRAANRDAFLLLGLSAVVPSVVLWGASRLSGSSVFELRYLMGAIPAQALLLGWLLGCFDPERGRRVVLASCLALALLLRGELSLRRIPHGREDWRGAIAALNAVNGTGPVLLAGSFTESSDLDLVKAPAHAAYLRAPLGVYPVRGPDRVLPLRTGAGAEAYVAELASALSAEKRFALLERRSAFPSWEPWLTERFEVPGYAVKDVWTSETLKVRIFERASP